MRARAPLARTPVGRTPLARAVLVGAAVVVVDLSTKMIAVAALGSSIVSLPAGTFLHVLYNDSFSRGVTLGAFSLAGTLLVAAGLLALLARVCGPLAQVDGRSPVALGLIGGAAAANAADFARTGRGVVDFLGVSAGDSAVVFNLADVAAYVGVALLVRTTTRLASGVAAERAAARLRVELALDAAFDQAGANARPALPVAPVAPALAAEAARARHPERRARPRHRTLEVPLAVPVVRDGAPAGVERPIAPDRVVLRFPSAVEPAPSDGSLGADPAAGAR